MPAVTIKRTIHACCPSVLRPALAKIEASEIGYRLAKGAFWSVAGTVISRGLMLIASIFVARILGKTGYGELGMIQSTVGMFGVFAGFGLGLTATKHVAEFRRNDPARAGRIIGLSWLVAIMAGGVIAVGLFIFAPWLAEHTINASHLSGVLRIGALVLFISALNGTQTGALSGFEAFRTIAYVNLFVGMISFPLLVIGAYWGGLRGAVWALAINLAVNWLLNHIALRKEAHRYGIPLTLRGTINELPILWTFSMPAVLGGALVGPVRWVAGAILVNQREGYSEMGIYNVANTWCMAMAFLSGILNSTLLPVLTDEAQDSRCESRTSFHYIHMATFLAIIPVAVLTMVLSPLLVGLYGKEYIGGRITFVLLIAATGISTIGSPAGTLLHSRGKMWVGLLMNLSWATVLLIVAFFAVPFYGAIGLALAMLISHTILALWGYLYQRSMLPKGTLLRTYVGMAILICVAIVCSLVSAM